MPVLQFLAVSIPWKGQVVPVIGVTDLMFFTTCAIAGKRLGWSETAALVVPLAGLLSAPGVGLVSGFTPALPFLAAAVLVYARTAPRTEERPYRG